MQGPLVRILWCVGCLVVFALSMDFWSWDKPVTRSLGGLPSWIFFFVGLQLLLALLIGGFVRWGWETAPPVETSAASGSTAQPPETEASQLAPTNEAKSEDKA